MKPTRVWERSGAFGGVVSMHTGDPTKGKGKSESKGTGKGAQQPGWGG